MDTHSITMGQTESVLSSRHIQRIKTRFLKSCYSKNIFVIVKDHYNDIDEHHTYWDQKEGAVNGKGYIRIFSLKIY